MRKLLWPLLTVLICLPLALVALKYPFPWLNAAEFADPRAVPKGDFEIAWFNATTSGNTWERFVTAAKRLEASGVIQVDDSGAFPEQTTQVPEIVLSREGRSAKLHIRWYKLNLDDQRGIEDWVSKLAMRDPAPLAVIGGSSSDRARNVAIALDRQTQWQGSRPLFFITNASAEKIQRIDRDDGESKLGTSVPLMDLYKGRSFRFCFRNDQITEAMLDFLKQTTPGGLPKLVCNVAWKDDPYSLDLVTQFDAAARKEQPPPRIERWQLPHSIGSFASSQAEYDLAGQILGVIKDSHEPRTILVIPTVPGPARRLLRALCDADPEIGRKLIAINGDGMGANTVLRDGQYLWPIAAVPVPLLLFCHANPIAHDKLLTPPSSTDDALHAAIMLHRVCDAVWMPGVVSNSDELAERLRNCHDRFFDADGNRVPFTGEFVLLCKPVRNAQGLFVPSHEVWSRNPDRKWTRIGAAQ